MAARLRRATFWTVPGLRGDLGKVETLHISSLRFDYTTRRQLVEHITLSLEILERFAAQRAEFPTEVKTVLQHLIVSHHGDLDKGALRLPMMPEAMALNLMDLLDARMEQAFRLIDQAPADDKFIAYVPALGRQLFRHFGSPKSLPLPDGDANGAAPGGKAA